MSRKIIRSAMVETELPSKRSAGVDNMMIAAGFHSNSLESLIWNIGIDEGDIISIKDHIYGEILFTHIIYKQTLTEERFIQEAKRFEK